MSLLLLIIVVILLFGSGGGYWGYRRGYYDIGGFGGIAGLLVFLIIVWLLLGHY